MLWGDMGWVGWVKFLTARSRQLLKPFTIYFMREKKINNLEVQAPVLCGN